MKSLATSFIRPGQTLAKSVLNKSGTVMLEAGTRLTPHYISRLKEMGVPDVYIRDDEPPAPSTEKRIRNGSAPSPIRSLESSAQIAADTVKIMLHDPSVRLRLSVPMLGDKFFSVYRRLLARLSDLPHVMEQLSKLHQKDPFLFEHTLNVSLYSAIVGFAYSYPEQLLQELMMASLFFDIGMLDIPDELYAKTGELTPPERKRMEEHTINGYRILSQWDDIPDSVALSALQHHERYDGSGYPLAIRGNEIHEYAQIISIADLYDALVSERHHRKPFPPGDAVEFLLGSGDRQFSLPLVRLFVRHISIYPVGSKVLLSSGQTAIIASVDSAFVQRPIVRIIQEPDGTPVTLPYEIDLKARLELVVTDLVN